MLYFLPDEVVLAVIAGISRWLLGWFCQHPTPLIEPSDHFPVYL